MCDVVKESNVAFLGTDSSSGLRIFLMMVSSSGLLGLRSVDFCRLGCLLESVMLKGCCFTGFYF
jgi:hypothetical protein